MRNILEITDFSKSKNKVLFDDGGFLVLYKGMLDKEAVSVSDEEYDELIRQMTSYAKKRAMNLLLKKDYSVGTLREKLEDDGYNSEVIEAVFKFLNSYHYLDDERVAGNLVNFYRNSKSIAEIRFLLKKQKLSEDIIETAIANNYITEEASKDDTDAETEVIKKLLKKQGMTPDKIAALDYKERQKLAAKFLRRGFKSENIRGAIRLSEFE